MTGELWIVKECGMESAKLNTDALSQPSAVWTNQEHIQMKQYKYNFKNTRKIWWTKAGLSLAEAREFL